MCYLSLIYCCFHYKENSSDKQDKNKSAQGTSPNISADPAGGSLVAKAEPELALLGPGLIAAQKQVEAASTSMSMKRPNPSDFNEFKKVFIKKLQAMEPKDSLINWVYEALRKLWSHFVNNKGTIICEYSQGVFTETVPKKNRNLKEPAGSPVEMWTPIFKKVENLKKGFLVFQNVDQGLFNSLILFAHHVCSEERIASSKFF